MQLFYYPKEKNHKSCDTDKMILESLEKYTLGHSLSMYSGEILRTKLGKPYIDYPLCVGVSHTDSTVVVAIDETDFGIDCEETGRIMARREDIARRFFTANERKCISSDADFLEIWVKKEAYVKFTGEGLSCMSNVDVTELCGFERIDNDKNLIIYVYKEKNNE